MTLALRVLTVQQKLCIRVACLCYPTRDPLYLLLLLHSLLQQRNLIIQQNSNKLPNRKLRPIAIHKLDLCIFMTLTRQQRPCNGGTCHKRKSLSRLTPLVLISKSGLGQSFVYKFRSMVPSSISSTSNSPISTAATISLSECVISSREVYGQQTFKIAPLLYLVISWTWRKSDRISGLSNAVWPRI